MNDVKSLWANWNWRFFLWWLREYLSVRVCLHLLGLLLNTEETSRKRWKLIDRPFKCVLACVILLSFRRTCIFVFFFFLILSTISLLIAVNLFWIDSIGWWFSSSSQIKISTFDWHWKNIFKSEKKILKPPSQTHFFCGLFFCYLRDITFYQVSRIFMLVYCQKHLKVFSIILKFAIRINAWAFGENCYFTIPN